MFTHIKRLTLFVAVLTVVLAGCAKKVAPPTSVMDTPEYHYNQGLKALDADRLDAAMREFDRALALDPKSALGYIGKGLTLGKQGDFKAAFENMEKAKDYEKKGIEARVGMIRLYSLQMAKEQKRRSPTTRGCTSIWGCATRWRSTSTRPRRCSARSST